MEFHNPTDVQSVPTVDALHVVNKKHKEEVDGLKAEMQSLRDRNDSQMKQLREWNTDTDYIEQDELKDDFDNILERSYKRIGKMASEVIWPTADQWASEFYFRILIRELDGTNDLRTTLTKQEIESIELEIRTKLREGNLSVYRRILDALRASAQTQAQYKKKKNSKLFESTTRKKIEELMDVFDCINVNGVDGKPDKELDSISKDIGQMIGKCSFDDIKEDDNVRNQSVTDTSRIAEKVEKKIRDIEDEIDGLV